MLAQYSGIIFPTDFNLYYSSGLLRILGICSCKYAVNIESHMDLKFYLKLLRSYVWQPRIILVWMVSRPSLCQDPILQQLNLLLSVLYHEEASNLPRPAVNNTRESVYSL